MKIRVHGYLHVALLLMCGVFPAMYGQSKPTASQIFQLSAFGGLTGTYTGLNGGRNLGVTAGADLGTRSFYSLYPSLEVRGTYPIAGGSVDRQNVILGGMKVAKTYDRFHPYVDVLFGRGEIYYENGGRPDAANTLLYIQSASNVISPGAGVDIALSDQFALKGDLQFQRFMTPVAPSGHIYSKPITIGLVYTFDFNRHFGYFR